MGRTNLLTRICSLPSFSWMVFLTSVMLSLFVTSIRILMHILVSIVQRCDREVLRDERAWFTALTPRISDLVEDLHPSSRNVNFRSARCKSLRDQESNPRSAPRHDRHPSRKIRESLRAIRHGEISSRCDPGILQKFNRAHISTFRLSSTKTGRRKHTMIDDRSAFRAGLQRANKYNGDCISLGLEYINEWVQITRYVHI
jgi:hypothetical protein